MKTQTTSNTPFDSIAALASSFSSPARLKLLYLVTQAPRSVESLSELTGESIANTSQHLHRLLREQLVTVRKEKLQRIYHVADSHVALFIESLFDLHETLHTLGEESDEPPVESSSIWNDIQSKKATLIDVRDPHETDHSPVDGAIAIPLDELKKNAKSLPKSKTYYVFCRGRACTMASEGVRLLRSLGLKAYRLKDCPATLRLHLNEGEST